MKLSSRFVYHLFMLPDLRSNNPAFFTCFLLCIWSCLLAGCKKDVLRWQSIVRLQAGTTDRLNQIFFLTDSLGFIPGGERFNRGIILKTVDGGASWQLRSFPEAGKQLYNVCEAPDGALYAIGFDGKLLRSTDSGDSWTFHQIWFQPYKDIYFPTVKDGLVIGGVSFGTGYKAPVNSTGGYGGYDSLYFELNDLEMVNPQIGYLAGYGVVLRTDDSAHTWQEQDIRNDNFTQVFAASRDVAWVCGYNGSIYKTGNGGRNWECMRPANSAFGLKYRLLAITAFSDREIMACGEEGCVIYSDDAGAHWMEFDRFTSATLRSVQAMRDGSILICGDGGGLYRLRKSW